MINYRTLHTHILPTKAVLTASTNLSSGSSRSDWAWEGVVDHIRELRVSDSYTERKERGGRREGREERGEGQKEREGAEEWERGERGRREERKRDISFANPLFSI